MAEVFFFFLNHMSLLNNSYCKRRVNLMHDEVTTIDYCRTARETFFSYILGEGLTSLPLGTKEAFA